MRAALQSGKVEVVAVNDPFIDLDYMVKQLLEFYNAAGVFGTGKRETLKPQKKTKQNNDLPPAWGNFVVGSSVKSRTFLISPSTGLHRCFSSSECSIHDDIFCSST